MNSQRTPHTSPSHGEILSNWASFVSIHDKIYHVYSLFEDYFGEKMPCYKDIQLYFGENNCVIMELNCIQIWFVLFSQNAIFSLREEGSEAKTQKVRRDSQINEMDIKLSQKTEELHQMAVRVKKVRNMMTSCHGGTFCIIRPLWGEWWISIMWSFYFNFDANTMEVQSSGVITRSNITRYLILHCLDWSRI